MKHFILGLLCSVTLSATAQTWTSVQLPFQAFPAVAVITVASPTDIYFGAGNQIAKSSDGGTSWASVYTEARRSFVSLGFSDGNNGFAGTISEDAFQTTDGGVTWNRLTDAFPEPIFGIDAMESFGQSLFAVGSTTGNDDRAYFLRSTDAGANWTHLELTSTASLSGLADVAFTSTTVGCISGEAPTGGVILRTQDGGVTFSKVYDSGQAGESIVDLEFVNANLGFAVLNTPSAVTGTARVLKTTDGGATWTAKQVATNNPVLQCVGFVNESRGWIGSTFPLYETNDGGETWDLLLGSPAQAQTIQRVSANLMLAGTAQAPRLFELRDTGSSVGEVAQGEFIHDLRLSGTLLTPDFRAQLVLATATQARLTLLDATGREVAVVQEGQMAAGTHDVTLPNGVHELSAGAYFLQLQTLEGSRTVGVVR